MRRTSGSAVVASASQRRIALSSVESVGRAMAESVPSAIARPDAPTSRARWSWSERGARWLLPASRSTRRGTGGGTGTGEFRARPALPGASRTAARIVTSEVAGERAARRARARSRAAPAPRRFAKVTSPVSGSAEVREERATYSSGICCMLDMSQSGAKMAQFWRRSCARLLVAGR